MLDNIEMNAVKLLHLLGIAGDKWAESRESLGRLVESHFSTNASTPPTNHRYCTGPVARKSLRAFYLRPTARTPSVSEGHKGAAWKKSRPKPGVTPLPYQRYTAQSQEIGDSHAKALFHAGVRLDVPESHHPTGTRRNARRIDLPIPLTGEGGLVKGREPESHKATVGGSEGIGVGKLSPEFHGGITE